MLHDGDCSHVAIVFCYLVGMLQQRSPVSDSFQSCSAKVPYTHLVQGFLIASLLPYGGNNPSRILSTYCLLLFCAICISPSTTVLLSKSLLGKLWLARVNKPELAK